MIDHHVDADAPAGIDGAALEAAVRGIGVRTVYQPIVDLHRLVVVGYEALTRFDGPDGTTTATPDVWFAAAERAGRSSALEAATLASALARRDDLPSNCFLTVNVEPMSLADPGVRRVLAEHGHLRGVIVELTEHRSWEWDDLRPSIDWLRRLGALVAVDDAGAGHSGLRQILELRPSLLKLDRALVAGVDRDEAKAALVEMMGLFASRVDAWLLAEGIETMAEAKRLIDLGVPLAQGYLFGRPSAPWVDLDAATVTDLRGFDDVRSGTLHALVEAVTAAPVDSHWANEWLARDATWLPVVDEHHHPLGVVDADAALVGELVVPLVANVHSSPGEIAARLSTAVSDPRAPVMVADDAGRYLGLVSVRRLLAHFAGATDT